METSSWQSQLEKAKKSAIVQGNLKKVHYAFESGREMVEEYNTDTNVVTRRAWKIKSVMGGEDEWDIEIGEPEPAGLRKDSEHIRENSTAPCITRRITKTSLEWRIRNLPYPVDVYSVTADKEQKCMTVRTTNKKYFKRLQVPELDRLHLQPMQENISFTHKFNTLIITYKKPVELVQLETAVLEMVKKVVPQQQSNPNDCRQS